VVLEELCSDAHIFFRVDTTRVVGETLDASDDGDEATLLAEPSALLNARVDPRTDARVGKSLRLALDPARFHFFDSGTGASLVEYAESGIDHLQESVRIGAP